MAEPTTLLRTHPLEAWSDAFAALPDSVGITVEPYVAMVDVRLGDPGRRGRGSTCRPCPTPGCRPTPGAPSGSGPTSGC